MASPRWPHVLSVAAGVAFLLVVAVVVLARSGVGPFPEGSAPALTAPQEPPIDHLVVIYLQNHSFDDLFGLYPGADGLAAAPSAAPQRDRNGQVYATLPQPRYTSVIPPIPDPSFPADLPNAPFRIGACVPQDQPIPDPIHAYYREQYQIDGGAMDEFAAWSDAGGLPTPERPGPRPRTVATVTGSEGGYAERSRSPA